MDRKQAQRLLDLNTGANRSQVRHAYMVKLREASNANDGESEDFKVATTQLRDAYEVCTADSTPYPTSASRSRASQSATKSFLGLSKRAWIGIAVSLGLLLLLIIGITGGPSGDDSSSATNPSSDSREQQPSPNEPDPPATVETPDTGDSGLLNTCWVDAPNGANSANGESTPVEAIACSSPGAQWKIYAESRNQDFCRSYYLTTTDGWFLCLTRQ